MSAIYYVLSVAFAFCAWAFFGTALPDLVISGVFGIGALTSLAVAAILGALRKITALLERAERNLWNVNLAQLEVLKHPEKDTPAPKFSDE